MNQLESSISRVLIPAITDRQCGQLERDILALPVRLGGLGVANPSGDANLDYTSSVKVTAPLVEHIVAQVHQLPEDSLIRSVQQEVTAERAKNLEKKSGEAEGSCATENPACIRSCHWKRFVYVVNVTPFKGDGVQPEQEGV